MASEKMLIVLLQALVLISLRPTASSGAAPDLVRSAPFREYIGAEFVGVKFTDVPINAEVEFHFILAFAIDYTADGSSSTDGQFNVFWDSGNLSPAQVAAVKRDNRNVRVALSLGGDSVGSNKAFFNPSSVDTWVGNAVSSLTAIIQQYHLDGVDIDYEHFSADPATFAECIGRLVTTLKSNGVISFASIAPFADEQVQENYLALWSGYGRAIDYVNFQFYAYAASTTVAEFLSYFETQAANYEGGRVLVSFGSGAGSGGLSPDNGFFRACEMLKTAGKLHGIFVWSADNSLSNGFRYERTAQNLLAAPL